jgi:hypothetical protein
MTSSLRIKRVRGPKDGVVFTYIFQHTAENWEQLREEIIDDVFRCTRNALIPGAHPCLDDRMEDMGKEVYGELKETYKPLLYFGYFSLSSGRTHLDCLNWKWTEATGKYIGCPYWSQGAAALFDEARKNNRKDLSLSDAWTIAKQLQSRGRPDHSKITHEHVYPRKDFHRLPFNSLNQSKIAIRNLFDKLCVGCVVLESEHPRTRLGSADTENPWMRYAGKIKLIDNPQWPQPHREMIKEAGLI